MTDKTKFTPFNKMDYLNTVEACHAYIEAQEAEAAAEVARLKAEVAWHVADKDKWEDVQSAHLREIFRLDAEITRLKAALSEWSEQTRLGNQQYAKVVTDNVSLKADVERLTKALEWYANLPVNWTIKTENGLTYGDLHLLGERARAVLTPARGGEQ